MSCFRAASRIGVERIMAHFPVDFRRFVRVGSIHVRFKSLAPSHGLELTMRKAFAPMLCLAALVVTDGCSVKKFAINKLGDSLANSGTTYAADDDLDLVGQALPFSLKLVEGLLAESPKHRGLLFTAASGFTEYAYAYVNQDADMIEHESLEKADALRGRARRLYLRARDYGLRGLDSRHKTFSQAV